MSAAAVLLVVGAVLLGVGLNGQQRPPQPDPAQAGSVATARPLRAGSTPPPGRPVPHTGRPGPTPLVLPRSAPVSIRIAAIGVRSRLVQLGLAADGTVQVPALSTAHSSAGWYRGSPTPGQLGPAIILGHVDSAQDGPAVFFKLGALKPGDTVQIGRTDGTTAIFRVDAVRSYAKAHFPTRAIYGNIDHAGLRLITCGGDFDRARGSYTDNVVVFASLTG